MVAERVKLMTRSISVLSMTCLALLIAPFVSTAHAAPAPTGDMGARMAAASDLLDAMGGRQSIAEQIERVVPVQMQALQSQFPSMTADTRRLIENSIREEMTSGVNQLLTQMAGAWARRFTVSELRQITAFHRSAAGQNLRRQQEDLQREIAEIGRNWGVEIGRRIQQRLQEHLTKAPALTS
jgi:hypothetical protein